MYKDGDTWYVLRLRFRNVILSVCWASKVEPHPDCLLAVTSLSWVGCFFASSRQTTAINVEPWDVVNACKTRETGRWCQQWECPGSERWGEISKVDWRENEVRGQIIDQLVWFCPLFSCLMHVFFKKTKKKQKTLTYPSFSSVTQLAPNSSFWAMLRSSILIGWSGFLGGSAAEQQLL